MLNYYNQARKSSSQIGNHSGLLSLKKLCLISDKIIDIGCGEGTRLNVLLPAGKIGWGIDSNSSAIKIAKQQYPHHHFSVADAKNLPFPDHSFDLVYSAFAIEHCFDPEKFISEMVRVCRPAGHIVILCPNYGAPSRRSPVSVQSPITKLLYGIWADYFSSSTHLNWHTVTPHNEYNSIDDDTSVEPYLHSLLRYTTHLNAKIIQSSSLWELEPPSFNPRKLLFMILGKSGLFPFKYWGPQLFIILSKS